MLSLPAREEHDDCEQYHGRDECLLRHGRGKGRGDESSSPQMEYCDSFPPRDDRVRVSLAAAPDVRSVWRK